VKQESHTSYHKLHFLKKQTN